MIESPRGLGPADIDAARALVPGAFAGPNPARLAAWMGFALVAAAGFWWVDFNPARLWEGAGKLGWLVTLMIPPTPGEWLPQYLWGMVETVAIAFLGTLFAAVVAVPLGFLGARNVVPSWIVRFGLRRGLDALRAVDQLIWALIFVGVVGLGPFAGVLAIAVSDTGIFAKLFAEAVENIERRPVEGVRASGAGSVQIMRFAMLPQVLPVMLSTVLYYFESNVRHATILGVVGAGGIGMQLSDRIRIGNWDEAAFIILMILATVYAIDLGSNAIRRRFLHAPETSTR